jgi:hypothetical protein
LLSAGGSDARFDVRIVLDAGGQERGLGSVSNASKIARYQAAMQ